MAVQTVQQAFHPSGASHGSPVEGTARFDTSGRTVYSQLSQSFGRTYESLRGRMHAAGDEHQHPPMDSAALEQLTLQISTIDGVSLTQAREQIDRFRGMSLPDVP